MTDHDTQRSKSLPHSPDDIEKARRTPDTPQTRAPAYKLAFDDTDFLTREELRPVRLQLELPAEQQQGYSLHAGVPPVKVGGHAQGGQRIGRTALEAPAPERTLVGATARHRYPFSRASRAAACFAARP